MAEIYCVLKEPFKGSKNFGGLARKKDMAGSLIRENSLINQNELLSDLSLTKTHWNKDCYSIFSVEPPHLILLKI